MGFQSTRPRGRDTDYRTSNDTALSFQSTRPRGRDVYMPFL